MHCHMAITSGRIWPARMAPSNFQFKAGYEKPMKRVITAVSAFVLLAALVMLAPGAHPAGGQTCAGAIVGGGAEG